MIPPAKRGDRLNADYLNRIIEQVNRSGNLDVPGSLVTSGAGGTFILPEPSRINFFDPSHQVYIYNAGTTVIDSLTPAHVIGTIDEDAPPESMQLLNRRVLKAEAYPATMHRHNHGVIALDQIEVGEIGRAYIDGLCIAKITSASRRYLAFAGWQILWEENVSEVAASADHYGIVRYHGDLGFWALLTAATSVATNRWKYSWTEKTWTISSSILGYSTPTSPRVGPFTDATVGQTGWAWNSTEMANTGSIAGSGWEDQSLALVSDTVSIGAINQIGAANNGSILYPVVWLQPLQLIGTGQVVYLFTGWNTPAFSVA